MLDFLYWVFVGLVVMVIWHYREKLIWILSFILKEGRWLLVILVIAMLFGFLSIYAQLHAFLSYKYAPVHPGVVVPECLKETCPRSKQRAIDRCVLEATRLYESESRGKIVPQYSEFFITDLRRCLKVEGLSLENCGQNKTGCIEVLGKLRSK